MRLQKGNSNHRAHARRRLKQAITWISAAIEDNPDSLQRLSKAVFQFDLSPVDAEFLMGFFANRNRSA